MYANSVKYFFRSFINRKRRGNFIAHVAGTIQIITHATGILELNAHVTDTLRIIIHVAEIL